MEKVYKYKRRYCKRIKYLYKELDKNESNSITLNEFFDLIDIMEQNDKWHIPIFSD
jgi:hypothetical protein